MRLSSLLHKYGEKICEASGEQSADPTGFSPLEGSLTQVDKVIFFRDKVGLKVRKPDFVICKQQRCRPACSSAHADWGQNLGL